MNSIDWFFIGLGMTHPPIWLMWFAIVVSGFSFLRSFVRFLGSL